MSAMDELLKSCQDAVRSGLLGQSFLDAAIADLRELRQQVERLKAAGNALKASYDDCLKEAIADRDHYREVVKEMANVLRYIRNGSPPQSDAIDALLARCEGEK